MRQMFENALAFNQDISGWCVSQVISGGFLIFCLQLAT